MKRRVLVVDSDASHFSKVRSLFSSLGVDLFFLDSSTDAIQMLQVEPCDAVIIKEDMTAANSTSILEFLKKEGKKTRVIVLSARSTPGREERAIQLGAAEYISHDKYTEALAHSVRNQIDYIELQERSDFLERELAREHGFSSIVGNSPVMRQVYDLIIKVGPSSATVLLQGESGTGKELVARAIHYNSPRSSNRFVTVNCAAVPRELLESEFFGHIRGAFTGADSNKVGLFESANKGTILLDEIDEIPLDLQSKLLRVIQEKEIKPVGSARTIPVDVRLISATNRDLKQQVASKLFREDLYYRLNTIVLPLPSLRDRREDVPLLIEHFLKRFSDEIGKKITGISENAVSTLVSYDWPGNVRELENAIERAVILAENSELDVRDFNLPGMGEGAEPSFYDPGLFSMDYAEAKRCLSDGFAKEYFSRLLARHKGNISHAATAAGLKRQSLHQILARLDIKASEYRGKD